MMQPQKVPDPTSIWIALIAFTSKRPAIKNQPISLLQTSHRSSQTAVKGLSPAKRRVARAGGHVKREAGAACVACCSPLSTSPANALGLELTRYDVYDATLGAWCIDTRVCGCQFHHARYLTPNSPNCLHVVDAGASLPLLRETRGSRGRLADSRHWFQPKVKDAMLLLSIKTRQCCPKVQSPGPLNNSCVCRVCVQSSSHRLNIHP